MGISDFYKKDEIDLADYLKILIKRKNTILAILLLCAITIIGAVLLMPNKYEASTVVRIGGFSAPFFTAKEALYELENADNLRDLIKALELDTALSGLREMIEVEDLDNAGLIRIKIRASCPKLAARICNKLADDFVAKGNEIYNKQLSLFQERIQKLETSRFVADRNRTFSLKKEIINSKDFKVLLPASLPGQTIISKERRDTILMILVFGIILSLLIVSFQEFWVKRSLRDG